MRKSYLDICVLYCTMLFDDIIYHLRKWNWKYRKNTLVKVICEKDVCYCKFSYLIEHDNTEAKNMISK